MLPISFGLVPVTVLRIKKAHDDKFWIPNPAHPELDLEEDDDPDDEAEDEEEEAETAEEE